MIDRILHYFPNLTECQRDRLDAMTGLYAEWNEKINVISWRFAICSIRCR